MELKENLNILAAFIVLTIVASFKFILNSEWNEVGVTAIFSVIILLFAIGSKKLMAYLLDTNVEHEVWKFSRYGWKPHWHLKKDIPAGIIFPLFLTLFSLGFLKFLSVLTYETTASKYRAAKRHGFYSFTEMTDWHNGLIGAAGIISVLALAIIGYFSNYEYLSKLAAFYAFSNLLPISKLDGSQIFFGSRILYAILAVITLIFFGYALFLI